MERQKLLLTQKENYQKLLTEDKGKVEDPCPVCGSELYHDEVTTKRAAIMDSKDNIIGWLCPFCKTEFDSGDNIVTLLSGIMQEGEC